MNLKYADRKELNQQMIAIREKMLPVFSGSFPDFCYTKLPTFIQTNYSCESDGNKDFFDVDQSAT